MIEPTPLLLALARQTLVLSLALPLILALRGPLLRRFGAALTYASWGLLPPVMLAAWLPASAPAQALRATVIARLEPLLGAATAPLPEASAPWWPAALALVWLGGALLGAARLIWLQQRFMQGLTPSPDGRQWRSSAGSGPALVGLLRPRLALPADFGQRFGARQQALVLAHEQVHLERRDNLWNLLASLLCLLHWFNPLAWLALRRMRADQELACDARVMRLHPGSEAVYGRALLLAQGPDAYAGLPWASWRSTHPLIERIEMLKQHRDAATRRRFGLALLALLAATGMGTVHALRADSAPAETVIELRMAIELRDVHDGASRTLRSQPTLRLAPGKHGTVMLRGSPDQPGPDQVAVEVWVEELGQSQLKVWAEIKKGPTLDTVSKPRLVTKDGTKARIELGRDDPRGQEMLSIDITPTVLGKPGTGT